MWYSGHDGSVARILHAVQRPGRSWERLGTAVDLGLAGRTDSYGVESPSVVANSNGYLMAYAGSDGTDTRLHLAVSTDGTAWKPLGTILPADEHDAVAATDPWLLSRGTDWWLFYSGYNGPGRASILAAVSRSGTAWERVGSVLEPAAGELGVSEPSVLAIRRRFLMFFVSNAGVRFTIQMATSADGLTWHRQGNVLPGSGDESDLLSERSPCALRLQDHTLQLWFAGRRTTDTDGGDRIWAATFSGRDDWPAGA